MMVLTPRVVIPPYWNIMDGGRPDPDVTPLQRDVPRCVTLIRYDREAKHTRVEVHGRMEVRREDLHS